MLRIHHTALYVRDLEGARNFFVHFLGARSNEGYYNPRTGLRTYFLTFGDGGQLEIMTRPGLAEQDPSLPRTGYAHVAFSPGGREAVDALTRTLQEAGYAVLSGPRVTGDGCYESCIAGPEGCLVELVADGE